MIRQLVILTVSAGLLAGCGTIRDSRVNPFNWFGQSQSVPVTTETAANPLIPQRRTNFLGVRRPPAPYQGQAIAEVSELLVERRAGGAIIRASGVADRLGPFDVRLVPIENEAPGTLGYTLSVVQSPGPRNTSPWSRTVTAARWLTTQELAGIGTIRVVGRSNQLVTRR